MAQQIQIAFDNKDEMEIVSWLSNQLQMFCTSYLFDTPRFCPKELDVRLETSLERRLLVFPAAAVPVLSEHVIYSNVFGQYLIDPAFSHGSAFEWGRTQESKPGVFVFDGGSRFFFFKDELSPLNAQLTGIVRKLFNHVKKISPLRSQGRYPGYVGASLARRIQKEEAQLIRANGVRIELVPNK
jgi:hypothetical protein